MTPDGDRRGPIERGPRQHVWPDWVRIGYRFLTTPRGEMIARILIGLFMFGMVAGWLMFKVIETVPPAKVEVIEQKVEQVKEAEENLERRIERVEEVIITP